MLSKTLIILINSHSLGIGYAMTFWIDVKASSAEKQGKPRHFKNIWMICF